MAGWIALTSLADAEDCTQHHPCIKEPDEHWPCKPQRVIVFDATELEAALATSEPGQNLIGEAAEILDDVLINEACSCAKVAPRPCPRCKVTLDEAREFLARIGYQGYVEPVAQPATAKQEEGK